MIYFGTYWQNHDTIKDYMYYWFDKSILEYYGTGAVAPIQGYLIELDPT